MSSAFLATSNIFASSSSESTLLPASVSTKSQAYLSPNLYVNGLTHDDILEKIEQYGHWFSHGDTFFTRADGERIPVYAAIETAKHIVANIYPTLDPATKRVFQQFCFNSALPIFKRYESMNSPEVDVLRDAINILTEEKTFAIDEWYGAAGDIFPGHMPDVRGLEKMQTNIFPRLPKKVVKTLKQSMTSHLKTTKDQRLEENTGLIEFGAQLRNSINPEAISEAEINRQTAEAHAAVRADVSKKLSILE